MLSYRKLIIYTKYFNMKNFISKIMASPYIFLGLVIILLAFVFFFWNEVKSFLLKIKTKKSLSAYENSSIPVRYINPVETAYVIHDAFYGHFFGLVEDEQAAINALMAVPPPMVRSVASAYFNIDGKNMYDDFVKYLSDAQYREVKTLLIHN